MQIGMERALVHVDGIYLACSDLEISLFTFDHEENWKQQKNISSNKLK